MTIEIKYSKPDDRLIVEAYNKCIDEGLKPTCRRIAAMTPFSKAKVNRRLNTLFNENKLVRVQPTRGKATEVLSPELLKEQQEFLREQEWVWAYGGDENWRLTRQAVFKRNKYTCVMCGNKEYILLRCHHLLPLAKHKNNELRNLITVCRACHQYLHPNNPNIY
jgi:hypothetical protein